MRGLVVFDMDGTIIDHNSWIALHRAFGLSDHEDGVLLRWFEEGAITYAEWTKLIASIYRIRGHATRARALEVFERCQPHLAARAVVAEVRARGYEIALISGGIDILVEATANRLGIERYRANHRIVFDDRGWFMGFEVHDDDATFKVSTVKSFCSDLGISTSSCICVGDGFNDQGIFSLTGKGILLCRPEMTPPFSHYWKRVSDLSEVPELIPH